MRRQKNALKDELFHDVIEQFENGILNDTAFLNMITTLSKYLNTNKNELLLDICTKLKNSTIIYNAAEKIYEESTSSKNLCLIATLLLKQNISSLQDVSTSFYGLSEDCIQEHSELNVKVFIDGYQLAESIASKAILEADVYDLEACCEVLKWAQTRNFMLCEAYQNVKSEIYPGSFSSNIMLSTYNTFSNVKKVFNICMDYIGR